MKELLEIYIDGSVSDNVHRENNKGAWCAIIKFNDKEWTVTGEDSATTNNRMELMPLLTYSTP